MGSTARGAVTLGALWLGGVAAVGCGQPLDVEPGEPVFELVTTGGFAGVYRSRVFHADGRVECAGDWCEGTDSVDAAALEALLRDLARAGFFEDGDRNYGADCCDQFTYALTARTLSRSRTVEGTAERLPPTVYRAIQELLELTTP